MRKLFAAFWQSLPRAERVKGDCHFFSCLSQAPVPHAAAKDSPANGTSVTDSELMGGS